MKTWTRPEDKAQMKDGPWQAEPDKAVWVDEATGLDCMIHRNRLGSLCGYVGLGPDHPLHGCGYDDVAVDVHGGLTYGAACQEGDDESDGLCHVPEPGRPHDVWWLGFDCGHAFDLSPGLAAQRQLIGIPDPPPSLHEVYRDFDYVRVEVEQLARQLAHQRGRQPTSDAQQPPA